MIAPVVPGDAVAGRYVVGGQLGTGGAGEVWRAHDELLGRDVALKVVRVGEGEADRGAVLREARVASRLDSPAIVTVYDVVAEDERVLLVMELLDGPTLEHVLRPSQPVPVTAARTVLTGVAQALADAHRAGVVHGDITPANVFWLPSRVVVCDFGLARVAAGDDAPAARVVGTPEYLAPERFRGDAPGFASDVWSWGAVAFHVLTGRPPFGSRGAGADWAGIAAAALTGHVERGAITDAPLAALVARALDVDPAARLADGGALLTELRAAGEHRPAPTLAVGDRSVPPHDPTVALYPRVATMVGPLVAPPPPPAPPVAPAAVAVPPPPPLPSSPPPARPAAAEPPTRTPKAAGRRRPRWVVPTLVVLVAVVAFAGAALAAALSRQAGGDRDGGHVAALDLPATPTVTSATPLEIGFVVLDNDANLRAAPGLDAEVLRVAPAGTTLATTGQRAEADDHVWLSVHDPITDRIGWVAEDLVTTR